MTDRTSHRSIVERWVIKGTLVLQTPAHFGNGDADPLTDMPLLMDEVEGNPLLPGTSITGALRNYLREREYGYGKAESKNSNTTLLFGSLRVTDEEGAQSPLIIDDAKGSSAGFELRDGVAIDPETHTAADEKKFDIQLLAAGSTFKLRFELIVAKDANSQQLRNFLYTALHGLEQGDITLGARKRRGFGQVTVKDWQVFKFDLTTKDGLVHWLGFEHELKQPIPQTGGNLASKLGVVISEEEMTKSDKRTFAHLIAHFAIDGTLMIRSGFGETGNSPDMVHLRSTRDGKLVSIIPGTSLAGALRQRALKIARTIAPNVEAIDKKGKPLTKLNKEKREVPLLKAEAFVNGMFGPSEIKADEKHTKASRVSIKETEIEKSIQLVVTRVKIDRFTGGAYESALFSEQPEIGKPNAQSVTLDLTLRNPQDAELGLLLLLLKDLWTGDLPVGGESSVGRGRLNGLDATLKAINKTWEFVANGDQVTVTPNADDPEKWVKAFNDEVVKAQVNHE